MMKLTVEVRPNDQIRVNRSFSSEVVIVGRELNCDLTIASDLVSARHAKLQMVSGKWMLSDLSSRNGTYRNGQPVQQAVPIAEGDEICFGQGGPSILVLEIAAPPEALDKPHSGGPRLIRVPQPPESEQEKSPAHGSLATTLPYGDKPASVKEKPSESASPDKQPQPAPPAAPAPAPAAQTNGAEAPSVDIKVPATSKPRRKTRSERKTQPADTKRAVSSGTVAFHTVAALVTAAYCLVLGIALFAFTLREPARGYTSLGYLLAVVGTVMFGGVAIYAWRKRLGQETLPGRLQNWLRLHLWLSVGALWLIMLHAGFHLDGGSGTWTLALLVAAVVTGVGGWFVYIRLPSVVYGQVGNLAVADARRQLEKIREEIEDAAAGRSPALQQFAGLTLEGREAPLPPVEQDEEEVARDIAELASEQQELRERIANQRRLQIILRSWLWVHVPLSILFLVFLPYHMYEAAEMRWVFDTAGPHDYASAESCKECHEQQYEEWIGSMHAIAMSSPVTELQNRLVLLKEQEDMADGKPQIVGRLCVDCHAPTGGLGSESEKEDPLLARADRAPASQFGVSCVSCHQIDQIDTRQAHDNDQDKKDNIFLKNAEDILPHYTQGRKMLGQLGLKGEGPSIGNSAHRGVFGSHFTDSTFCASCHTVVANHPQSKERIVKLQNTYNEWLEGNDKVEIKVNWGRKPEGLGVECMQCHSRDLGSLVAQAKSFEDNRTDLRERLRIMQAKLIEETSSPLDGELALAATPADGFDGFKPLPPRRRYLHTFVGVDHHLETDLPYPADHKRAKENAQIQKDALDRTANLLRIAAAIKLRHNRVSELRFKRAIEVDVLNLATGHHLPAGFAFAREMWVEVAVSQEREPDDSDWDVLVGGIREPGEPKGRSLKNNEELDVSDPGLKNFQAILFDDNAGTNTVLQNEATVVINTGGEELPKEDTKPATVDDGRSIGELNIARRAFAGQFKRQKFMLPGEIRHLEIDLPVRYDPSWRRIRVRLLFRSYPPAFLEGLAQRYDAIGDPDRARRCRAMIGRLHIHEMASDEISSP